jgi:hypothetical protein
VFLRSKSFVLFVLLLLTGLSAVSAQTTPEKKDEKKPEPAASNSKDTTKPLTVDQVVESSLFVFAPGGRETLTQIRKTTIERGKVTVTRSDGVTEKASYQKFVMRAPTLDKEKIRLDQDFPSAKYSLVYDGAKIFGIFRDQLFTPREDASKGFENQIIHGQEALMRYKENESKIEIAKRDKILGVDFYVVEVTDKLERKTRFFISAKSWRVMMLEYEEGGVKYLRKFYDYNYVQGTLVPFRTVLWVGDKIVEETDIGTVSFGQKVDEGLFVAAA